ncbi:hypothetical protein M527_27720 [Sphingobium indicum IP26]|nr:hypothetical protein M527_27720 [Sphingobium indicum IP26]
MVHSMRFALVGNSSEFADLFMWRKIMRASVSKNVAAIKAASIEIGSRIEEAEDIEAAVKLCEKLTEACRLDHEAGFQILRPLRMPTGSKWRWSVMSGDGFASSASARTTPPMTTIMML